MIVVVIVVMIVVVIVMMVVVMAVPVLWMHHDFMTFPMMRMVGLGVHPATGQRNSEASNPKTDNETKHSHHLAPTRCNQRAKYSARERSDLQQFSHTPTSAGAFGMQNALSDRSWPEVCCWSRLAHSFCPVQPHPWRKSAPHLHLKPRRCRRALLQARRARPTQASWRLGPRRRGRTNWR
jgi:hypothetical protein